MSQVIPRRFLRYGRAVLAVVLAMLLRMLLTWLIPALEFRVPFALFFISVMVATLYGGRGPGVLAIVLSAVLAEYFILAPINSFSFDNDGLVQIGVFICVALVVVYFMERLKIAESMARRSEANLLTTLKSIGDGVITTDSQARIVFMNEVGQTLTGWRLEDARGREITDIFKIINEETRREVANPIHRVLREGVVVGLANHTVLVAKDGMERPVEDSGAPIKDEDGKITGVVLVFHDVTERRRAEELRLRLASIIESSDDAILGKTLEGVITSWNIGAERLYGYSADEMIGQPIARLAPPDRADEITRIIERLKRGERVEHLETLRVRKDGRKINVALTISPIKNTAGHIIGASTIARDITERKLAEEERAHLLRREQEARIEAEHASRIKDEFLATLSHELRTPLTAMLGWTRMLRMKELDEQTTAHALETIERNVKAQAQLIEDLLDVSRIITGKLRLEAGPMELVPIIKAALDSIQPASSAKNIQIQTTLDPRAGPVSGDPARLQQVVWNLLSNAVKFTPRHGSMTVSLSRTDSSVEFNVRDTGQGINTEFLPHVFERFRQADSSTTRAHGGLGLGLAIVRHLVELHGGTVHAESEGEGHGSTFTVRLPLRTISGGATEGNSQVMAAGLPLDCPPTLNGLRVLIVDDEADARSLLVTLLEQCGAHAVAVSSAEEALLTIQLSKPDLLLSDIGMPGMDGYALISKLRSLSKEEGGRTPAIALTAYASEDDRRRALVSGFQMHVAKPVDPVELALAVERLARETRGS
jgi:PAS domain S-box-containing protein